MNLDSIEIANIPEPETIHLFNTKQHKVVFYNKKKIILMLL